MSFALLSSCALFNDILKSSASVKKSNHYTAFIKNIEFIQKIRFPHSFQFSPEDRHFKQIIKQDFADWIVKTLPNDVHNLH